MEPVRLVDCSPVCGQAHAVTNSDPINNGQFSQTLVQGMGIDARSVRIPGALVVDTREVLRRTRKDARDY
jgi:hypothetical protein